ncbi:MAG: class I SAM-dependent methyltransferase [Spirochaetia bacterium]|nr:class I SAM-dependent methyltransferase [Spirochaetia bacterium]
MDLPDKQQSLWNGSYASNPDFFGSEPSELAKSSIAIFKQRGSKTVLELGCGQGRDTWYLIEAGLDVTALDYSEAGICQMRKRAEELGVECRLEVHDALQALPFPDNHFDAVYSHMFFTMRFDMDQLQFMFKECLRVLRPGGIHVYSVRNYNDMHYGKFEPRGEDTWENPLGFVVHFFSEEKVRSLADGYHVIDIKEFVEGAPPFNKTLFEVVLAKP